MSPSRQHPASMRAELGRQRAFGVLPAKTLDTLAATLQTGAFGAGETIAAGANLKNHMHWLLEGRVELLDAEGQHVLGVQPGELFGLDQGDTLQISAAKTLSDSQLVQIPLAKVRELCEATPAFAYFLPTFSVLPEETAASLGSGNYSAPNLMTMPVRELIQRAPITLPPNATIRAAAQLMSEQRVSSVLIEEGERLIGLVTDRDLRNRVIAAGFETSRPVLEIATLAPITVDVQRPAFEALLLMARHNIHHVPVLDGEHTVGMITATDINEQHSTSAVYLSGEVYKHSTIEGLQTSASKVKRLQQSLAAAQASAYSTGHIITAITDAITCRLLQLGEAKLGPPPVDYVWVAAGSQARSEQTAKSDQDNCMVLDDRFNEAQHGAYFKALSTFVCDGLDACGYIHCPGEMMAMTDTWRQPKKQWAAYFARWTGQPDPKSLMLTCVFFDLRAIYGKEALLATLRADVLQRTQGNTLFLAHMAGNAMLHQPPLGMFKGLTLIRSGEHKGKIDMKHTGVVPIVDLARVYALAGGHDEVNTHDRLLASTDSGAVSKQSARDLRDALEFLAHTRIQYQAQQIATGLPPDNFLDPKLLSNFERTQLKDAFTVVHDLQNVLGQRYRM